MLKDMRCL